VVEFEQGEGVLPTVLRRPVEAHDGRIVLDDVVADPLFTEQLLPRDGQLVGDLDQEQVAFLELRGKKRSVREGGEGVV